MPTVLLLLHTLLFIHLPCTHMHTCPAHAPGCTLHPNAVQSSIHLVHRLSLPSVLMCCRSEAPWSMHPAAQEQQQTVTAATGHGLNAARVSAKTFRPCSLTLSAPHGCMLWPAAAACQGACTAAGGRDRNGSGCLDTGGNGGSSAGLAVVGQSLSSGVSVLQWASATGIARWNLQRCWLLLHWIMGASACGITQVLLDMGQPYASALTAVALR